MFLVYPKNGVGMVPNLNLTLRPFAESMSGEPTSGLGNSDIRKQVCSDLGDNATPSCYWGPAAKSRTRSLQ